MGLVSLDSLAVSRFGADIPEFIIQINKYY